MTINPSIQLSLLQFFGIIVVSAVLAILFARSKLLFAQKRITELENEMLRCHHEILTLSKQENNADNGAISTTSNPGLCVAS